MKLNKTILQGLLNLVIGLIYFLDMIFGKRPISPVGLILFSACILGGIYLIYDGIKTIKKGGNLTASKHDGNHQ
jgi:threonine/homoserine/homoserine lactone efflux protein